MAQAYTRTETVAAAQITGTLTGYVALVSRTHNDFRTIGNGGHVNNANGYDLCLYTDSGLTTLAKQETEKYVAATGEVVKWVYLASAAVGTVLYWGYGDTGISTSQDDATNVWPSNYKVVYHLGDGSTIGLADSTSNARTLTNNATVTAAAGQIHGGTAKFNGSTQYLSNAAGPVVTAGQAIRVSYWRYMVTGEQQNAFSWSVGNQGYPDQCAAYASYGDGTFYWDYGDFPSGRVSVADTWLDAWAYVEFCFDGTSAHTIRVNGAQRATATNANAPTVTLTGVTIGKGGANFAEYKCDEFRVWVGGTIPSTDYSAAEYANQSAPTTFWTLGSESMVSAGAVVPVFMNQYRQRRN